MKRSLSCRCVSVLGWGLLLGACAALTGGEPAPVKPAGGKPKEARPNVPKGYRLLYSQNFEEAGAINDFEFTDPGKWKLTAKDGNGCLESLGPGKYRPKVRSPHVIALLSDRKFEDFILEANLMQTGREYGHRDMCLFLGFTDPGKYYYVHIATRADNHAHNIFIVNDKPRTKTARKTTKGIKWGKDKWHRVRLERKGSDGTIRVFFDDMKTPIMEGNDKTFKAGCVGFGSFDDVGRIDNVRIWGPKMTEKKSSFFKKKTGN